MEAFYPIFIAFLLVFFSELGDKTQLLVLSFSNKVKSIFILLGVALGSFFSHGIAILLGSRIGLLDNSLLHDILDIFTFLTFIFLGILSFIPPKDKIEASSHKRHFLSGFYRTSLYYTLIIASSIAIGEFGDKTFLASIGLGISYPFSKFFLIIGAILGMVASDSIAILFGRFLSTKISEAQMRKLSGVIFIVFGLLGFVSHFVVGH